MFNPNRPTEGISKERLAQIRLFLDVNAMNGVRRDVSTFNVDLIPPQVLERAFTRNIKSGSVVVNIGHGNPDVPAEINPCNSMITKHCAKVGAIYVPVEVDETASNDYKGFRFKSSASPIMATADQLPFRDGSIDFVLSSNLINCPPSEMRNIRDFLDKDRIRKHVRRYLEEIFRTLKPGGVLLISSFGYFVEGINEDGSKIYNNEIQAPQVISLAQINQFLNYIGYTDIVEIEPDTRSVSTLNQIYELDLELRDFEEAGGFIARKPGI